MALKYFPLHFSMWLNYLFFLPPLAISSPVAKAAGLSETLDLQPLLQFSPLTFLRAHINTFPSLTPSYHSLIPSSSSLTPNKKG